jgi:DNA-binding HxlR family transcriptional regulator
MKKMTGTARRSDCPLNLALELVGDAWTLLIVRDLMFKGKSSFRELMDSEEGMASSVLTDRLGRLMDHGLIERRLDAGDRRRTRYVLTPRGRDLGPVLVELMLWSSAYETTAAPADALALMRADRDAFLKTAVTGPGSGVEAP